MVQDGSGYRLQILLIVTLQILRGSPLKTAPVLTKSGTYRFEIYPNPNDGTFTVKIQNQNPGWVTIRLQNMLSIPVFEDKNIEVKGNFIKTYGLNDLSPGIYILTIETNKGENNIKMIIR